MNWGRGAVLVAVAVQAWGAVAGRVVEDHTGSAVSSAAVRVIAATGARRVVAELETDREGRFSAPNLPDATYTLEISKRNYVSFSTTVQPGAASALRMIRCGVIAGRVADARGNPLRSAGVRVMMRVPRSEAFASANVSGVNTAARADANGEYRIFGLPPGEYAVAITFSGSTTGSGVLFYPNNTRPQLFTISGGEEHRADFIVAPGTLSSVSGRVLGNERAFVSLVDVEQPSMAVAEMFAAKDGAFRFEGIPAGAYDLLVTGRVEELGVGTPYARDGKPTFGRARANVTGSPVENVAISLAPGTELPVRVTRAEGAQCPPAGSLSLTTLERWGEGSVYLNLHGEPPLVLKGVAPARFQINVTGLGEQCFYEGPAVFEAGQARELAITLVGAASVRGKLVGAADPRSFAVIFLAENGQQMRTEYPDAQGAFAFTGLRPGRYRAGVAPVQQENSPRWVPDWSKMTVLDLPGRPVEIELPAPE